MYLREMGAVELLSREGEIAIAKRIEAGRNTMIAGLCESPMTFNAITIWCDELTVAETSCCATSSTSRRRFCRGPDRRAGRAAPDRGGEPESTAAPLRHGRPRRSRKTSSRSSTTRAARAPRAAPDEEEDDDNNLSLAAMEETLKPRVLETFERIADLYEKFAEMQDCACRRR